jgi:hypothetical protein
VERQPLSEIAHQLSTSRNVISNVIEQAKSVGEMTPCPNCDGSGWIKRTTPANGATTQTKGAAK